ncbi:gliding motility-associated C-terminal domain-containing protein [Flavobacterium sp. MMLR14_040]|uniref:HYR-like domain-containing protein n=1 Tax=Flavobacterium sp. MMLR14_040 TaxID=3093843 RepID=UPI0029901EA3|nr:gliding motility-associated C-terminal domain-containing protein [Flavobacterium sp. MMLR14_040]MDW8851691.1 gliding motility-associated C-terminal domain-containing protein [Flavobacterium sp. MMLR14_040]
MIITLPLFIAFFKQKKYLLVPITSLALSFSVQAQSPGGVSDNLRLWLKANSNVTPSTDEANVTTWANQTGSVSNALYIPTMFTQTVVNPTFQENIINFNPSLRFNGTSNTSFSGLEGSFSPAITSTNISAYVVTIMNAASSGSGRIFMISQTPTASDWQNIESADLMSRNGNNVYGVRNTVGLTSVGPILGSTALISTHFTTTNSGKFESNSLVSSTSTTPFTTTAFNSATYRLGQSTYSANDWYNGDIAEVILYDADQSSTINHNQIQSYLAIKYGIHKVGDYVNSINTTLWDATANLPYHNDVFGIGQDSTSDLSQVQSNSMNTGSGNGTGQTGKGNIVITSQAPIVDNTFLIIGHDTGALTEINIPITGNITKKRVQRIWKAQSTGNPGNIALTYDTTGLTYSAQSASDYLLLVDPTGTGDFTSASVLSYPAVSISANKVLFNTVNLPTGSVFSFQTQSVQTAAAAFTVNNDTQCIDINNFIFTNTSTITDGSTIASYNWDFGDGQTSTDQNPTHVYAAAGIFTVTLQITTDNGSTNSTTQDVIVNPLPSAIISYQNTQYCQRGFAEVVLTGENGGTYSSDPGLSIDSNSGEINLSASVTGSHTITYSFSDGTCSSTTSTTITIDETTSPTALPDIFAECAVMPTAPTLTDACAGTITATTSTNLPITSQGLTTIMWDFDYGYGFIQNMEQDVTVLDITAPDVPILSDVIEECSLTVTPPTTNDNCIGLVTGTTTDPLTYNTQGTYIIHWIFEDGHGNTSTADQNVIVDDLTPPATPVLSNVTGECSVTPTTPTTTDICGGTITGTTLTTFPITTQGTTVVTWTFDDANGNISTANQNVILDDVTPPLVPILTDIIGECSATPTPPTTTDNCAGIITGTTLATFPITSQGTTIVTWTFDDGNGNISTANQNVIIDDVTPPVVPTLTDVTDECSATPLAPTTTDNCAGTITGTTLSTFPITVQGTTVVTWTFDDGNGNISTANQNVILDDVTPPIAPTLADVTAECTATPTPPTTTDNCTGTITGTTLTTFPINTQGATIVTWTFDDGNGNISTANQNVILNDLTPPTVPILVDIMGECSVTPTAPTTTDICSDIIIGVTTTIFPITTQGTTVVTWTFDDANGNISTANQNVILDDVTPPVVPTLANVTGECFVTPTAPITTDNCAGTITGTTLTTFPITSQGTTIVTWTFDDGNGNISTANQNVILDDVTPPLAPILTDIIGECSVTPTPPITTDNCAGTITGTTLTTFPITVQGTTIVTWTFDDGNGNISTANHNVILDDVTPPLVPTLADVTAECSASPLPPTTTDNCAGTITGTTLTIFPITVQGTTVVTWTFDDGNGNASTANQNVNINYFSLIGSESTMCSTDASNYILTLTVEGQAPYTAIGTGAPGTWNGETWTSNPISSGTNYNVSIEDSSTCNPIIVSGTAPICCSFEVSCPTFPVTTVTCYNQIPTAENLTVAEFESLGNGDGSIGGTPCGAIEITASNSNDPICNGSITRTYIITEYYDPNNNKVHDIGENTILNTVVCTQNFIKNISDFTMPANQSSIVACASSVVTPTIPVVMNNCGNILAPSPPIISTVPSCNGTVTYSYNFTDCEGSSHDWIYTYTINNTVGPTGTKPPDLSLQCITDIPAADINSVTNIESNCGGITTITVSDTNNAGSGCNLNPYVLTRTYTLTDCGGLTTNLIQTITVIDKTAPVFVEPLPSDISIDCSATVPIPTTLTATDNCSSATVTYNENRVNGNCPGNYQLQRTWTASDVCDNKTIHQQIINVNDTTAPVFTETLPPALVNANCETIPQAVILTAKSNCGNATVTYTETRIDGDCSTKYTLDRTWVAADECGNQNSFTQTINVSCLTIVYNSLSPNGDGMNDTFKIGGVDCYPNNNLKIFNRYGVLVYEKEGYDNITDPFEGISKGRATLKQSDKLPTGTYFYALEYKNDGNTITKSGYLFISNN